MGLLKENYGQLGKLHRGEWKKFLNSNEGLFKRVRSAPSNIIGPQLGEQGEVIGDLKVMETIFFEKVATNDQYNLFKELGRVNPPAANEYMFTISGSVERWKEDIKWLEVAVRYLKKEEIVLEEREELIKQEENVKASVGLPPVLKRHFPHLFKSIDMKGLNFTEILDKIKKIEQRISSEKNYLEKYLKKQKHELPFLFE